MFTAIAGFCFGGEMVLRLAVRIPGLSAYDKDSAELAWERTLSHFKKYL